MFYFLFIFSFYLDHAHFVVEIFGKISDQLLRFETIFPMMLMGITKDIAVDLPKNTEY